MPKYPFMNALVCVLFIGLGLGAVLDPTPQDLTPKITGSLALAIAAGSLWYLTKPGHTDGQRRTTVGLFLASVILIPLIWFVR